MKNMILTESRNHAIPAENFVADWIISVQRYHSPASWQTFCMPRMNANETLATALQNGKAGSMDVMLRMLAPASCRNTMQSTNRFMEANAKWLDGCQAISPKGRNVQGAKLSKAALSVWNKLGGKKQDSLFADAEALVEADIEVAKDKKSETTKLCESGLDRSEVFPYFDPSHLKISVPPDWVQDFVRWVAKDPFQPRYRRNPHGPAVEGWGARLNSYFWPNPSINASATAAIIDPFTKGLKPLYLNVQGGVAWNTKEQSDSIICVNSVFKWGGVAARPVTWQIIHDVMESVAKGHRIHNAPMNSAWTKVAAFASADTPREQVIWDSRVATAVVSRLDAMFMAAKLQSIPFTLNGLGYVTGRGGSRPRRLGLNWVNGYARWKTQFAASLFVKEIKAYLNINISSFPKTDKGTWTLRDVEQVLFMDGY